MASLGNHLILSKSIGRGALQTLLVLLILFLVLPVYAQDYAEGRLIVKMKGQSSFHSMNQSFHQKSGDSLQLKRSWSGLNMHEVSLKPGQEVSSMAQALRSNPEVEYAEPDYYVYQQSFEVEPGTLKSYSDYQLNSGGAVSGFAGGDVLYQQSSASIQMEQAWQALSSHSGEIVVAVIDSGVDYNHSLFLQTDAIWQNPLEIAGNGQDNDGNGYIDDVRGWNFVNGSPYPMDDSDHGTHVAGIILGAEQNIFGPDTTNSRIKIMPLKFLDSQGRGTTSDAIQAIFYAVNNGAHVLNNSWGGGGYSQALREAVEYAYANNVLFVAAAGNHANNNDQSATYPASYELPNVLSVAASNDYDYLASFSNYGKQTVLLSSPGQSILSTLPNNTSGRMSGTSMAAPLTAGLAALMIYENSSITAHQIREVLGGVSDSFYQLDPYIHTGRINALSSIVFAQSGDLSQYERHPELDSANRTIASDLAGGSGCSAIAPMAGEAVRQFLSRGPGGPSWLAHLGVALVLLSPVLVLIALKLMLRSGERGNRRYARYNVMTDVVIRAGDREFKGSVSSLSMGGVRVDTQALLEQGGVVHMKITSPDGSHDIEVSGEVVWSEKEKAYGVAFSEIGKVLQGRIAEWQKTLVKSA